MGDKKVSSVRGGFLVILGLVSIGIGASIYYGEFGVASLTKGNNVQHFGNTWAYLPVGLGVVLMIAGTVLVMIDNRTK